MAANGLFLILLASLALAPKAAPDFSQNVCKKTFNITLCSSIVKLSTRADLKTSYTGIATILRDGGVDNIVLTNAKIKKIKNKPAYKRITRQFDVCAQGNKYALQNLSSIKSPPLNKKTYSAWFFPLSDASQYLQDCSNTFKEIDPNYIYPIYYENQKSRDICTIMMEVIGCAVCKCKSPCSITKNFNP